jgi:predicted nucleic acid-binding protein
MAGIAPIILSDASPLIVLSRIDGLHWLKAIFGVVHVTLAVRNEVLTGKDKPGEAVIRAAVKDKSLVVLRRDWKQPQFPFLGEGEAACIRAAVNSRQPSLLLMDDRPGRSTAMEQGFKVAGTAAVIAMAKRKNVIPSATAVFEQLLQMEFRLSAEEIRAALDAAGETPVNRK